MDFFGKGVKKDLFWWVLLAIVQVPSSKYLAFNKGPLN